MYTIGIDPGLSGAVGVLKNGTYQYVHDMPVIYKGTGTVKSEINPLGLREIIEQFQSFPVSVALERISAMPMQGVASMFSMGDSFGVCRSVATLSNYPLYLVTPAKWKNYFKIGRDKEEARALALRLFPEAPLNLKKHSDRAEALLIARYLWEITK